MKEEEYDQIIADMKNQLEEDKKLLAMDEESKQ